MTVAVLHPGILKSMNAREFRHFVFNDPDQAAILLHSDLISHKDADENQIMYCACFLSRLSSKVRHDPRLNPFYQSYLSLAVKWSSSIDKVGDLTNQIKNFLEIDRLKWIDDFLERNSDYLSSPSIVQFAQTILDCVEETDRTIAVWCGSKVTAEFHNFDEAAYLSENEDVKLAVSAGGFKNALDHFKRCGHREGRYLRVYPADA